jgi:hypothetical protein
MNKTPNVLGGEVWRRGARLGLRWTAVFFGVMAVMYLLLGVTGWSGTVRALCAMGIGPVIGTLIIVVWWGIRRPAGRDMTKD